LYPTFYTAARLIVAATLNAAMSAARYRSILSNCDTNSVPESFRHPRSFCI
jgi:hypothetical protein